jgi:ketosteroid isomerase-like protein
MGATVFSIEPPNDVWSGERTDPRHWNNVIYPTLRQIIDQRLIASKEDVLARAKVAYQMRECSTLHEYDEMLEDVDFHIGGGHLAEAAYGFRHRYLMKELIPDTGGRYYFIPLLPVGTPKSLLARFEKVIQPGECSSAAAYRQILDRYYAPTENAGEGATNGRACVLKCGRAIAVMQSRENLFERQAFTVELPRWVTGLRGERVGGGVLLTWDADPEAKSYRVWRRIEGAKVYPEWEVVREGVTGNSFLVRGVGSGTFGVTARTAARQRLSGTVNYTEYLLFRADESPIVEQVVVMAEGARTESVSWTDESLPASQEVWRIFEGVPESARKEAEEVLETWGALIAAFTAKDIDGLMSFYDPAYRDSNGYGTEYVRRAWLWWFQRQARPHVTAQVRAWDCSRAAEGIVCFTAWNRFWGIQVWDEPFGYHGRVRIPRHKGERVAWTWKRDETGRWKVIRTEPALPNFGEMLWNARGHDVPHTMSDFADTPGSASQ